MLVTGNQQRVELSHGVTHICKALHLKKCSKLPDLRAAFHDGPAVLPALYIVPSGFRVNIIYYTKSCKIHSSLRVRLPCALIRLELALTPRKLKFQSLGTWYIESVLYRQASALWVEYIVRYMFHVLCGFRRPCILSSFAFKSNMSNNIYLAGSIPSVTLGKGHPLVAVWLSAPTLTAR